MGDSPWNSLFAPIALFATSGVAMTLARRWIQASRNDANSDADTDADSLLLSSSVLKFASVPPDCHDAFYDLDMHASLPSSACGDQCDCTCGFKRPEFKKGELMKLAYHDHQVFICRGMKSTEWPANIDREDPICREFNNAFKRIRGSVRVRLNVVEEGSKADTTEGGEVDVLIFPDAIRYVGVKKAQVANLVETHFVQKKLCDDIAHEQIDGTHVFVCSHHLRDTRCSACGPRVYKALVDKTTDAFDKKTSSKLHSRCNNARIYRTSCVMGHKYAGNVIIFKYDPNMKKYFGDWYGFVNDEEDIDRLVESHLIRGKIVKDIWRGRCAMELDSDKFLKFQ